MSGFDNPDINRHPTSVKETQLFDWLTEPKDERPSEFHTTGFTTASGYHHSLERQDHPVRQRSGTSGLTQLLGVVVVVLGLGGAVLYGLVHWLRG